jgi:hypothetical protein
VLIAFESLLKPLKRCGGWFVTRFGSVSTRESRSKKERPVETAAALEIDKGASAIFLDDFHSCLEKPVAKTAPGFPTVTTGPATTVKKTQNQYPLSTIRGGCGSKKMARQLLSAADGVVPEPFVSTFRFGNHPLRLSKEVVSICLLPQLPS